MQKNQPEQIRAIDGLDQVRRDGWMDEDEACGSACTDVQVVYRTGQDQDITLHLGDGSRVPYQASLWLSRQYASPPFSTPF